MADHLTEEEQIEALKNWWKEYWMSIVLPILLAAVGYFAWNTYQTNQETKAKQGSLLYQEMVSLAGEPNAELTEEKRNEAEVSAQELIEQFSGTLYADRAKLLLARFAAEQKDYDKAAKYLGDVVSAGANEAVQNLARARLARVSFAQGNYDKAISLVATPKDESFKSLFAEVRGDALAAKGDTAAATTAYQEALDHLGDDYSRRGLLDLKMKGVAIIADAAKQAPVQAEPAAEAEVEASPEAAANDESVNSNDAAPAEQLADEGNS
ncbi:hypothetical protein TDB9533_03618 [Thalassocella blandensis]|nr:hypothetical protein TDB9533_03618 [Thalassocella blandensis]